MENSTVTSSLEVARWVTAGATLLAVLVALFKEEIVRLWRRPKITLRVVLAPPDCHKTEMRAELLGGSAIWLECFYFRAWVENVGNARAERVQIFAAGLSRQQADGSFRKDESFLPMNFKWSHSGEIYAEGISPGMGKHCDLFHISDPAKSGIAAESRREVPKGKTVLALDLEFLPATLSHLLPPGVYRLVLKLAAANAKPVEKTVEINHTGDWFADERKMFTDGLGIRDLG